MNEWEMELSFLWSTQPCKTELSLIHQSLVFFKLPRLHSALKLRNPI